MKYFFKSKGFTLVELLIVTGLISALTGGLFLLVNPKAQFDKTKDSQRQSDISQIQKALELYYEDTNCYPTTGTVPFGSSWDPYMKKVPQDPDSASPYIYSPDSSACPQWNVLFAKLTRPPATYSACSLPADSPCVPPGYDSSYYCAISGNTTCTAPALTPTPGPLPTSTPTPVPPAPKATPTPVAPTLTPTPTSNCTNGYLDFDKDGFGVGAFGCYRASTSYNIVNNNTDCYDSNTNAKPGQTQYFPTDRGDGSFDYDCNGVSSKNPAIDCLATLSSPACYWVRPGGASGFVDSVPACGASGTRRRCNWSDSNDCSNETTGGTCSFTCETGHSSYRIEDFQITVSCR